MYTHALRQLPEACFFLSDGPFQSLNGLFFNDFEVLGILWDHVKAECVGHYLSSFSQPVDDGIVAFRGQVYICCVASPYAFKSKSIIIISGNQSYLGGKL